MSGREGERVEIKQRVDGDYQWAKVAGNNRSVAWNGEGLTGLDYAWAAAARHNPGLPVFLIDEEGGIIEERRPTEPPSERTKIGKPIQRGDRLDLPDGRTYYVTSVGRADNDGRVLIEVMHEAHFTPAEADVTTTEETTE